MYFDLTGRKKKAIFWLKTEKAVNIEQEFYKLRMNI